MLDRDSFFLFHSDVSFCFVQKLNLVFYHVPHSHPPIPHSYLGKKLSFKTISAWYSSVYYLSATFIGCSWGILDC